MTNNPLRGDLRAYNGLTSRKSRRQMLESDIQLALEQATQAQLEKALRNKRRANRNGRRGHEGQYCPNGCGSIRNVKAMRRHLTEECKMPLLPGDASSNWLTMASNEVHPPGPYDVGFPPDTSAKCEIIMGNGTRYTSVYIRRNHDGIKMWDPGRIGIGLIDPKGVVAWKVQEHFA